MLTDIGRDISPSSDNARCVQNWQLWPSQNLTFLQDPIWWSENPIWWSFYCSLLPAKCYVKDNLQWLECYSWNHCQSNLTACLCHWRVRFQFCIVISLERLRVELFLHYYLPDMIVQWFEHCSWYLFFCITLSYFYLIHFCTNVAVTFVQLNYQYIILAGSNWN